MPLKRAKIKLSIFIIVAASAFVGCKIKDPYYKKIDNVVVVALTPSRVDLSADLILHNPNNISCTLKEVAFDIFTDKNIKLTSIKQSFYAEMVAKSDFVVPVTIAFDPKKLVSESGGILGSLIYAIGNREVELIYKGTSKVEKLGITISVPIEDVVSFALGGS